MQRRISLSGALTVVVLLALFLNFCIVPIGRHMEWTRLERQIDSYIRYLKPTPPSTIKPGEWDCAHSWIVNAYCNICFSPEHTAATEMYRLRKDLRAKLRDRIDLETLKWIWNRLGQTGPYGKQYTERFGPLFRDCFSTGSAGGPDS
jgi:hypothetical protein